MHARMSRMLKDIDERLARCAAAIESDPTSRAGSWASTWYPADLGTCAEVRLDLGCGRGGFTIEAARREPDVLFVGIDNEVLVVACAARNALEAGVRNVVFACADSSLIRAVFAPGEVARLYLNFSTPFPRKKEARGRLTYVDNLVAYYDILAPGATLCMKTDSQPFRDFTLTQLDLAGYELLWSTDDLRAVVGAIEGHVRGYVDHAGRKLAPTGNGDSPEAGMAERSSRAADAVSRAVDGGAADSAEDAPTRLDVDRSALHMKEPGRGTAHAPFQDAAGPGAAALLDSSLVPPEMCIATEYEARLVAEGAKVLALQARPVARPATWEQTAPVSLIDYLPADLENIGYVPYGMGDAVVNLRNRRRKEAARMQA